MNLPPDAYRLLGPASVATFSQLWRVVVTLGTQLVLRRFVQPGEWGVWDWVLPVFLLLSALRDLGLTHHLGRLPTRPLANLLAVEVFWGGLLAATVYAGAPWIAGGFPGALPELVPAVRILAVLLFVEGLASVPRAFFEAEPSGGRLFLAELSRSVVFAAAAVILALLGLGLWSMVLAYLGSTVFYTAYLWLLAREPIELRWERGRTLSLIAGSLPLGGAILVLALASNLDPLLLATRFDAGAVGRYGFAYFLANVVVTLVAPTAARAFQPALVAFAAQPSRLFAAYRLTTLGTLSLAAPFAFLLFVNADTVVVLVGGGAWEGAPALLRILCFAPLVDPFGRLGNEMLAGRGRERYRLWGAGLTLAWLGAVGWWLTGRLGPAGMAWANYAPLGPVLTVAGLYRIAPRRLPGLLRDVAWIYLVPLPLFALPWLLVADQPLLRLLLSVMALLVCLALSVRRFGGELLRFVKGGPPATEPPPPS